MIRNLPSLVVGVVLLLAMALPALGAPPAPCDRATTDNCGVSTDHRNNASGKGNFGQCVNGAEGSQQKGQGVKEVNPNPNNSTAIDCRSVSDRNGTRNSVAIAVCQEYQKPVAEAHINFPTGGGGNADCVAR